jgi:protein O-GlcNAc transferase
MGPAILLTMLLTAPQAQPLRALPTPDLQRAQQHDREGWKRVDARDYAAAAREFSAALQIHPEYADALHGLGKSEMALQRFEDAAEAFERCRSVYQHMGSEDAERRTIETRARQEQVRILQLRLQQLQSTTNRTGSPTAMNEVLDLRQQIRDLEGIRDPGSLTGENGPIPAFISLALGSAYFRLNRLPDAERMFREALAADPRFGEAHSNLALVCVLTGRADEAAQHVKLAEQASFTINPELKRMIRDAKNGKLGA